MMVGNSMRSDVLPAIAAGAWGTFVPHGLTWEVEHAEAPVGHARFREIEHLGRLPDLVAEIESSR
jgi:putative hydrolase of the HAD superfamily